MDSAKFQDAQQAYDAGDFRSAAKGFLASAGRGAVGNGAAYHMAGNSLMRLRRYGDAVTVYGHALRDETYDRRGVVYANLGAAYVALGEMTEAVTAYEAALAEPDYATPYKAWQGIAAVHMERGRAEDAAVAYRRAALDEKNPDPGKALINLGLCFMALGRPSDAADAYKAALGFDEYAGRGKALANLGQAYTAMGEYGEAVKAFEKATQLHGHALSSGAQQAYESALQGSRAERQTIEGWVTGEMPPIPIQIEHEEPSGWATGELGLLGAEMVATPAEEQSQPGDAASLAAAQLGFGDEAAVTEFFSLTEDEMKVRAREARRAERGTGNRGSLLRHAIALGLGGIVLVVAVSAAYFFGLGWPTQGATVKGLLVAYQKGEAVDEYWVAVPENDVKREMAKMPPLRDFRVDDINSGRETSKVTVTVTPQEGAEMQYVLTLVREGVGWRVTGLDYNWRSTGG